MYSNIIYAHITDVVYVTVSLMPRRTQITLVQVHYPRIQGFHTQTAVTAAAIAAVYFILSYRGHTCTVQKLVGTTAVRH